MLSVSVCVLCTLNVVMFVDSASLASDGSAEAEEVEASKCSEEYENCGYEFKTINITDSMIVNATDNDNYDSQLQRLVKVHGYCCAGLVCKTEGYEEEPLPPGVTHFCADPDNDLNRERMFNKWKKSLEMPPNYSY